MRSLSAVQVPAAPVQLAVLPGPAAVDHAQAARRDFPAEAEDVLSALADSRLALFMDSVQPAGGGILAVLRAADHNSPHQRGATRGYFGDTLPPSRSSSAMAMPFRPSSSSSGC